MSALFMLLPQHLQQNLAQGLLNKTFFQKKKNELVDGWKDECKNSSLTIVHNVNTALHHPVSFFLVVFTIDIFLLLFQFLF